MNLQICGRRTSLISIQLSTKSAETTLQTKVQDVNDSRQRVIDVRVGVAQTERLLLTMALISGADVSMPAFKPQKDILNIHCDMI